jgi:hypothetical protein
LEPFISLASNCHVSKAALKAGGGESGHPVDETISNLALKELNNNLYIKY